MAIKHDIEWLSRQKLSCFARITGEFTMIEDVIKLCALAEIEDGSAKGFDLDGSGRDDFFVVRRNNDVVGWRNFCPHKGYEGSSMPWKKDRYLNGKRSKIICSAHGAMFDIETGVCSMGPCLGEALKSVDVQVGSDGYLYFYRNVDSEK